MKPVIIINSAERLSFPLEDSTFFYRRILRSKREELLAKSSERGETNWSVFVDLVAAHCLLGWENVCDPDGQQVPFSQELIAALPPGVIDALLGLVLENSPESCIKNWPGWSSDKKSLTDLVATTAADN